jgi:uncharacterized tellurite resistance protein B-like protein
MTEQLDLSRLPEHHLVAFYGLLFAMAAADGTFQDEELVHIHRVLDLSPLGPDARDRVDGFRETPPGFRACLDDLADASDELRWGIYTALQDLALADHHLDEVESRALGRVAETLGLESLGRDAVARFVSLVSDVAAREDDDETCLEKLRQASESWLGAGLPPAAAYFSGGVQDLVAAQRERALSALGLGLGFVPGVGVAVAIGSSAHVSVSHLIDTGPIPLDLAQDEGRRKNALQGLGRMHHETNRLAQRVEEVAQEENADAETAEELAERLRGLRALLATRRSALED